MTHHETDLIFLSYDEPNADDNFRRLIALAPHAKRVRGVVGIYNAYQACADLAASSHFFMVDGDNWALDQLTQVLATQKPTGDIHIWSARNAVNGLRSFNGGLKLLSRNAVRSMENSAVDYFLSMKGETAFHRDMPTETRFNATPYLAWRCGFRECAKLTGGIVETSAAHEQLHAWQTQGSESPNGVWCIRGARMGAAFGTKNRGTTELWRINDPQWLKQQFEECRSRHERPAGSSEVVSAGQAFERAQALQREQKFADAERIYEAILRANPDQVDALHQLGIIAIRTRRFERGAAFMTKAIALKPDFAVPHSNLGYALEALGRRAEAVVSCDRAIAIDPRHAGAHVNRGLALFGLKRFEDALASYDKAIALDPRSAPVHSNRGNALNELKRFDEALESYAKAIALDPNFPGAFNNRGITLNGMKRNVEAVASYDRAIALNPNDAEFYNNRGFALTELGRLDDALADFDRSMALDPHFAKAHHNRADVLLLRGRFEEGLPELEYREKSAPVVKFLAGPEPVWLGRESLSGKTLLIRGELYFGDTIFLSRYAKLAEAQGARVVLAAHPRLMGLLRSLPPTIAIVSEREPLPPHDFRCPLMSLPLAFKTTVATIPADVPYLRAEPDRVARWRQKLGDRGFKIGICWQGSTQSYAVPLQRSCALADFAPIARLPGVRLISLQKSDGLEQLSGLPAGMAVETLGEEFDSGPDAFLDTAAIMESLDLVITVDTAIAHIAGALARPVWVVVKHVPDWRWLLDRPDSPWYPTMRLFRQNAIGNWTTAFASVATELAARLGEKTSSAAL